MFDSSRAGYETEEQDGLLRRILAADVLSVAIGPQPEAQHQQPQQQQQHQQQQQPAAAADRTATASFKRQFHVYQSKSIGAVSTVIFHLDTSSSRIFKNP